MKFTDALRTYRRDRRIRAAYGTPRPAEVPVPLSGHRLSVNPDDGRVRKTLLDHPLRGRVKTNIRFWQIACAAFRPTVALDVGVNYGECLFGGSYPEGCRVHGFEANPGLIPHLNRSRGWHPQTDRITVHHAAVTDRHGGRVEFVVNPEWTGTSHLKAAGETADSQAVDATCLDAAVDTPTAADRVLFKVDVEGFEPGVFAGGLRTLCGDAPSLGFVEFDPGLHAERGFAVEDYWPVLAGHFDVFVCRKTGQADAVGAATWAEAAPRIPYEHCDLILVSRARTAAQTAVLDGWRSAATAAKRAA